MTDTIKLRNNITIHKINEPKFNEVLVNMKISMPLSAYQNTVASLLIRMIGDRSEAYPSKLAVRENLDTMYGTKTSTHTYTLGTQQVMDISIKSIHSRFVEENLVEMQLNLLKEMVYSPLLNEQTLSEAKVNLKHHHARIKESTSSYAMQQAFMNAAPGTLLEINSMGNLEDVDKVSLDEIKHLHDLLINDFTKDIILVGDVADVIDFDMFESGFSSERVNPLYESQVKGGSLEIHHPGTQTELILIYSTDITPSHTLYGAYLVFCALLGQLPSSYLFQNIREKHSLAYSVYSSRQVYDGLMYIATGINDENLDKAKALIHEQFELMKQDTLDIESAVRYLTMSLEGTFERLKPIADHTYRNIVLQTNETVEDLQAKLKEVSEYDVKRVMEHLSEPFVFAYRGDNNE